MVFVAVYVLLLAYAIWSASRVYIGSDRLGEALSQKEVRQKARNALLIQFLSLTGYFGLTLVLARYVFNQGGVGTIFLFTAVGLLGGAVFFVYFIYRSHSENERLLESLSQAENDLGSSA